MDPTHVRFRGSWLMIHGLGEMCVLLRKDFVHATVEEQICAEPIGSVETCLVNGGIDDITCL